MKRRKLLRITLASEIDDMKREFENPERQLYCLALVVSSEAINKRVDNAAQIMRNVAEYMDASMAERDRDYFVSSCLSRAGFGMGDSVDIVGKLGHLERLCEAIYAHFGYDLPEYVPETGYPSIAAVHRTLPRDGGRVVVPVVKSDQEIKDAAPWVKGRLKTGTL